MARNKSLLLIVLLAIAALYLASFSMSQIITNNPSLWWPNPTERPSKNDVIRCRWEVSTDVTKVQVTWFNGTEVITGAGLTNPILNPSGNRTYLDPDYFFRGDNINCSVNATNSTGNEIRSINITVMNAPPPEPNATNLMLTEDVDYTIFLGSQDPDSDTVTFNYEVIGTIDTNFTMDNTTGVITWTPDNASIGLHMLRFQARDDYGGVSQYKNVTYTVAGYNDDPYFSPDISSFPSSVYQNQTLAFVITAHDEETENGPFNFTVNSTYHSLLNYSGYECFNISSTNNKTGTLAFAHSSPALRRNGTYTVTLTICELNTGGCSQTDFNITVISTNYAPFFMNHTIGSWMQGQEFLFYVNASDYNTGDELSFTGLTVSEDCQSGNPWELKSLSPNIGNLTGMINLTAPNRLNNSHVDCRNITIYVTDTFAQVEYNILLEINNTNDQPVIHETSYDPRNSHPLINSNITNLTAIYNLTFSYKVNATDPDTFIETAGESLTYWTNASACVSCPSFGITSDGLINTTITDPSYVGNLYSYLVNVSDVQGNFSSAILTLFVKNNSVPSFNESLPDMNITEDGIASFKANASDPDFDDNITFSDNNPFFQIAQDGNVTVRGNCSMVNVYDVAVTASDQYGASAVEHFNLTVNFEDDAPVFTDFPVATVVGMPRVLDILNSYTFDEDLADYCINNSDTLRFAYKVPPTIGFSVQDQSPHVNATLILSPDQGTGGTYLINVTVMDAYGNNDTGAITLTVYNQTLAPEIMNVTAANSSDLTQWLDVEANFPNNYTRISFAEDIGSVIFNQTTIDPDSNSTIYTWLYNGTYVSSARSYSMTFGYNSSGNFNLTFIASDNISGYLLNNVSFTWYADVANVNRPPYLTQNFLNIPVYGAYYSETYFTTGDSRYVDPDGDVMNFSYVANMSSLEHCNVIFNESSLYIIGTSVGLDSIVFQASDGTGVNYSNNVTINVTAVIENNANPEIESSSTTRTRTTTVTQTIIEEVEIDTPVYLDIITPEPVTIYINDTIRAPIRLENKANLTLRGITLSAASNNSLLNLSFVDDYIPQLNPGQSVETELIITAYKTFPTYEINIYANITDPKYSDTAIIYVNSLEKSRGDSTVTNTKITFAHDLLSSNPECIELNEFLNQAKAAAERGDYTEAAKIIDSVVEGCKYLVSKSNLNTESPTGLTILSTIRRIPNIEIVAGLGLGIISVLILFMVVTPKGKVKKK